MKRWVVTCIFILLEDALDFDKECRRLLSNIHYYDVLRSDRSISSHGLEARTPFLDRSLFNITYPLILLLDFILEINNVKNIL